MEMAYIVADMEVDMVADMEIDMVTDMEVDMKADIEAVMVAIFCEVHVHCPNFSI